MILEIKHLLLTPILQDFQPTQIFSFLKITNHLTISATGSISSWKISSSGWELFLKYNLVSYQSKQRSIGS